MNRYETLMESEAWRELVSTVRDLGKGATDRELANVLREAIYEVEGDEI